MHGKIMRPVITGRMIFFYRTHDFLNLHNLSVVSAMDLSKFRMT